MGYQSEFSDGLNQRDQKLEKIAQFFQKLPNKSPQQFSLKMGYQNEFSDGLNQCDQILE